MALFTGNLARFGGGNLRETGRGNLVAQQLRGVQRADPRLERGELINVLFVTSVGEDRGREIGRGSRTEARSYRLVP